MKRGTDVWYIHCRLCSVEGLPAELLVRVDTNEIKLLYPYTLALSPTTSLEIQTERLPQLV